ncbi:MAG: hypothetical protein R2793_04040 [Flavobacteriaceae bacterium]
MFQFYFIGQFVFLSLFYFELLKKKWVPIVLFLVLGVLALQYVFDPSSFLAYNTMGVILTQSVVVVYSMLYFYKMLSQKGSFLIVNNGIFLYLMASVLFFSSGNLLLKLNLSLETMRLIGFVNDFFYFVFIILIVVEWYRNFRPTPLKV